MSLISKTLIIQLTLFLGIMAACDNANDSEAIGNTNTDVVEDLIDYEYEQPPQSICDHVESFSQGFLCALKPSRLDPIAKDSAGDTGLDRILGFGYHALAFPNTGVEIKGVYIHFTGTYGRPYNQEADEYASHLLLKEAVKNGFIAVQVAYDNRASINSDVCVPNLMEDNCAGNIRLEKIKGFDASPLTQTELADSIEYRLIKIVDYLKSEGIEMPIEVVKEQQILWNQFRVGGHSQGAGHAYYIAKNYGVLHACFLGGPFDVADLVNPGAVSIADWYLAPGSMTSVENMHAALAVDDQNYIQFIRAYEAMGLIKDSNWFEVSAAAYVDENGEILDGHAAILKDPMFEDVRVSTCFH